MSRMRIFMVLFAAAPSLQVQLRLRKRSDRGGSVDDRFI